MEMEWINPFLDFKLLLLLGTANTMPIVARHIFKDHFSTPIDFNRPFLDGRPILGTHKTWRGVAASVFGTWIASFVLDADPMLAIKLASWSMIGDMFASFIKRRKGLKSGAKCTGVDQAIEAFLPLAVLKGDLAITWYDTILITVLFVFFEIVLSPFFYKIGFRRNPY